MTNNDRTALQFNDKRVRHARTLILIVTALLVSSVLHLVSFHIQTQFLELYD